MGAEASLRWSPVLSRADIKTETCTVSNTGPGDKVSVEIVARRQSTTGQIGTVSVEIVVYRTKDWPDVYS